ncbi:hypothetical protein, partial [Vibrio parahaemolyticus]
LSLSLSLRWGQLCLAGRAEMAEKEKPRGLAPIGVIVLLAAIQLLKSAPCIESLIACCIPSA